MEEKKMNKQYLSQLKAFREYMGACFDVLMAYGDHGDVDSFYRSEFEITFRGKSVTLANGADVFQAIEEIIQTEIDNEEE
jgi:hypothetical protein